jgi:hypothetical protein
MNDKNQNYGRQIHVPGMVYAPTTELGVVFLFGRLAKRLGFSVEQIRPQYPDCIAIRNGRRFRIEFEMWASSFEQHGHDPDGADLVVCWENDWEARGKRFQRIGVLSLKEYADAEPRVFMVGCKDFNFSELDAAKIEWNVPSAAQVGDLIIMYRGKPTSAICDVWRIEGGHRYFPTNNKAGRWPGIHARLRRLAKLQKPVTYEFLNSHRQTRNLTVVKMRFRAKCDVTNDWPKLCDRILQLNPSARENLKEFIPD